MYSNITHVSNQSTRNFSFKKHSFIFDVSRNQTLLFCFIEKPLKILALKQPNIKKT